MLTQESPPWCGSSRSKHPGPAPAVSSRSTASAASRLGSNPPLGGQQEGGLVASNGTSLDSQSLSSRHVISDLPLTSPVPPFSSPARNRAQHTYLYFASIWDTSKAPPQRTARNHRRTLSPVSRQASLGFLVPVMATNAGQPPQNAPAGGAENIALPFASLTPVVGTAGFSNHHSSCMGH